MTGYLLIASRDAFESRAVPDYFTLAADLAAAGTAVTVFLIENGVLGARRGAAGGALEALAGSGVEVLADDFSLRERGIALGALASGVAPAAIDIILDHLAAGRKALWH